MPPSLDTPEPSPRLMYVEFYLRSGRVVYTDKVTNIEMTRESDTGAYSGYKIEWAEGFSPRLFSLSIPEIAAVVARDV